MIIKRKEMKKLHEYLGKEVTVYLIKEGRQEKRNGVLTGIKDFESIEVNAGGIPFLGDEVAIWIIQNMEDIQFIYKNPFVIYEPRNSSEVAIWKEVCFGRGVANSYRKRKGLSLRKR